MKVSNMSVEEVRNKLNPTEYTVACNPEISLELKRIIKDNIERDFGNYDTNLYYMGYVAEALLHEPEEHDLAHINNILSEQMVNEILMLEKAYDILMFVSL